MDGTEPELAGKMLKAKSGWRNAGNGTDDFGFSALPGGCGNSDGSFNRVGHSGYWWASSETSESDEDYNNFAYGRGMNYDLEDILLRCDDKSYLFSVRCVREESK